MITKFNSTKATHLVATGSLADGGSAGRTLLRVLLNVKQTHLLLHHLHTFLLRLLPTTTTMLLLSHPHHFQLHLRRHALSSWMPRSVTKGAEREAAGWTLRKIVALLNRCRRARLFWTKHNVTHTV
jgi:hypothetical protein